MVARIIRARVRMNSMRYVLIIPCCRLLAVVIKGRLEEAIAFGPVFSSHV